VWHRGKQRTYDMLMTDLYTLYSQPIGSTTHFLILEVTMKTVLALMILATALLATGRMLEYNIEWLWVFAPMWIPFCAALFAMFLMIVAAIGLRTLVIISGWLADYVTKLAERNK
jgi:hypothetical protein